MHGWCYNVAENYFARPDEVHFTDEIDNRTNLIFNLQNCLSTFICVRSKYVPHAWKKILYADYVLYM